MHIPWTPFVPNDALMHPADAYRIRQIHNSTLSSTLLLRHTHMHTLHMHGVTLARLQLPRHLTAAHSIASPAHLQQITLDLALNVPPFVQHALTPPAILPAPRYDRKELTFRKIMDVQFVAAMGPPGGGRHSCTNRYLRHFSVVSLTAFDNDNLR